MQAGGADTPLSLESEVVLLSGLPVLLIPVELAVRALLAQGAHQDEIDS